jgi:hypothetical protein
VSGPEGLSADLHRYLQQGRDALLRAVDGVSEYDARRPPASESREYLVDLYCSVWAVPDAAIADLPLDAPASVAWWPEERRVTTFGHLLVRVVAETAQHAGHADILREGLDGQGGPHKDDQGDAASWSQFVTRIQQAADEFRCAGGRLSGRCRPRSRR